MPSICGVYTNGAQRSRRAVSGVSVSSHTVIAATNRVPPTVCTVQCCLNIKQTLHSRLCLLYHCVLSLCTDDDYTTTLNKLVIYRRSQKAGAYYVCTYL